MPIFVILLPLINFLLLTIAPSIVSWRRLIAFVLVSKSLAVGWVAANFEKMILGEAYTTPVGEWFDLGLFSVSWTSSIDPLTQAMLFIVMLISTLVHNYSVSYMREDPHMPRFLSYLSLFTFFMLVLISSDNFVGLFLGWEGVGLCSYLLISFWYTRLQANKAAIKAMIVNRIADMAFTLGMLVIFYTFQTFDFSTVFALSPYVVEEAQTLWFANRIDSIALCTFFLFVGAMGKSAQLGLHTWLPDAMEGPSPVSALIHAATMVTAGVYLLVRSSPMFELSPQVLYFVGLIGAATAIMAATSGLLQNDMKKVIAYSTCSQLGYMTFANALSQYAISLFHLINHAWFKALLFLTAGSVIHGVENEQDTRKFGALSRLLPFTCVMFVVGSLALMGFPFLSGYYSKDLLMELAACGQTLLSAYANILGVVTAFFTAYYSFRLLKLTFYGVSRSPRAYLLRAHELDADMAYPLAVLAIGSIFFGYFVRDLFVGFGSSYWGGVIADAVHAVIAQREGEFLTLIVKFTPVIGMFYALALIIVQSYRSLPHAMLRFEKGRGVYRFFSGKWEFDPVLNRFVATPTMQSGYHIWALNDKGLLEVSGPTGLAGLIHRTGVYLVRLQTGRVFDYALFMVAALALILALVDYATSGYLLQEFAVDYAIRLQSAAGTSSTITFITQTVYELLTCTFVVSKPIVTEVYIEAVYNFLHANVEYSVADGLWGFFFVFCVQHGELLTLLARQKVLELENESKVLEDIRAGGPEILESWAYWIDQARLLEEKLLTASPEEVPDLQECLLDMKAHCNYLLDDYFRCQDFRKELFIDWCIANPKLVAKSLEDGTYADLPLTFQRFPTRWEKLMYILDLIEYYYVMPICAIVLALWVYRRGVRAIDNFFDRLKNRKPTKKQLPYVFIVCEQFITGAHVEAVFQALFTFFEYSIAQGLWAVLLLYCLQHMEWFTEDALHKLKDCDRLSIDLEDEKRGNIELHDLWLCIIQEVGVVKVALRNASPEDAPALREKLNELKAYANDVATQYMSTREKYIKAVEVWRAKHPEEFAQAVRTDTVSELLETFPHPTPWDKILSVYSFIGTYVAPAYAIWFILWVWKRLDPRFSNFVDGCLRPRAQNVSPTNESEAPKDGESSAPQNKNTSALPTPPPTKDRAATIEGTEPPTRPK